MKAHSENQAADTVDAVALSVVDIKKQYPGTLALDGISIDFYKGSVHALLGKNGAGKSTLVKIIAGSEQPTTGTIILNGSHVKFSSPMDAFSTGIAIVYQELSIVPGLTVAENIFLGRMPKKNIAGIEVINWAKAYSMAEAVLADMNVTFDVRKNAGEYSVAQQQVIEIAKAMSFNPSVLMLDEPTSALARHETESLFALIRKLRDRGVAIIYISHRLQELKEIVDTVSVLRDGRYIGTVKLRETTQDRIVQMMFGEVIQKERPVDIVPGSKPVLEVSGLSYKDKFHDVSFTLYEGEVLGIAGMLGSGRTELMKALFGAEPAESGEIRIGEKKIDADSPSRMLNAGMAFTPENRKEEALIQIHSIRNNMCMASMNRIAVKGVITRFKERQVTKKYVDKLQIKVADIELPVSSLSGGNQQKVVVGNMLETKPRVILFDEPTRGIDVQAKQQIFQVMWDLSREGISSIFVSTELEELVEVCNRILIMKHGRIAGEVNPDSLTADELFLKCLEE